MGSERSVARLAAALAAVGMIGGGLAWGGSGARAAGAGGSAPAVEASAAGPVCRTAPSSGDTGEGSAVEETRTQSRPGAVPPIDTEAPARTELATFALG